MVSGELRRDALACAERARVAQGGGERAKRDAKADDANLAKQRERSHRSIFHLQDQTQEQRQSRDHSVDWDYVFFERDTQNELGRQELHQRRADWTRKDEELVVTITSPPTRTVSVTS